MRKPFASRLTGVALAMTLSFGTISQAAYASSEGKPYIGSISVNNSISIELNDVSMLTGQDEQTVSFTVIIHNKGNDDLSYMDYWVKLQSKSGSPFKALPMPQNKGKSRVAAHSSQTLSYYAKVDRTTKMQDLVVQFFKFDFSMPNFERSLGKISVPDSYSGATPAGKGALLNTAGKGIEAKITKFSRDQNEKYYLPMLYLELENKSDSTISLPEYSFFIRTSEGFVYPLETQDAKNFKITPKETKLLKLKGSIPSSVSTGDWELLISQNIPDLKLDVPVGNLLLPEVTKSTSGEAGQEYAFTNNAGTYTAKFSGVYRLPWDDQDILNATVKLSNKGDVPLPTPNLTAYFLLDDSIKVEAQFVKTDDRIGFAAGSSVDLQFIGKIPYNQSYSNIKLVLQEKGSESDAEPVDILKLSAKNDVLSIPFFRSGSSYKREDVGHKSEYKITKLNKYTGPSGDLYAADLEVDNLEKRYSAINPLAAHFRAKDGTTFPAQVSEIKDKVGPSGKALFQVWAMLPNGYPMENMQILLGDAVSFSKKDKDGKQSEGKPDAYVSPVAFGLPDVNTEVKNKLSGIELFPYTISMNKINTTIDTGKFFLKFDYEITKNRSIKSNAEGHKLVVIFEDGGGLKSFERSYDLKDFESNGDKGAEQDSYNQLKLGKKEKFTITVNDEDLIYKSAFLKKYNLSLYDEFQGQRKLLSKQSIDWFTISD